MVRKLYGLGITVPKQKTEPTKGKKKKKEKKNEYVWKKNIL